MNWSRPLIVTEIEKKAEAFFLDGMTQVMGTSCRSDARRPYQSPSITLSSSQRPKSNLGTASTGWETFLDASNQVPNSRISGTWPMRTERNANGRVISIGNQRPSLQHRSWSAGHTLSDAPVATRREFIDVLKSELPDALRRMQQGNIAPVDLAQAAIGPGMAVFTRFARGAGRQRPGR